MYSVYKNLVAKKLTANYSALQSMFANDTATSYKRTLRIISGLELRTLLEGSLVAKMQNIDTVQ